MITEWQIALRLVVAAVLGGLVGEVERILQDLGIGIKSINISKDMENNQVEVEAITKCPASKIRTSSSRGFHTLKAFKGSRFSKLEAHMAPDTLLQQSHTLRADFFKQEGELYARLAHLGQRPKAMFVGCSDSRVIPERLMGARPGDVYVLRNTANIIPPFGTAHESTGAALEHAVNHLRIAHLIICGHTECGGIRALDGHISPLDEPSLSAWIRFAREAQTRVDRHGVEPARRHRAIVEQNVILQLEHVASYPAVYKAMKKQQLELHGWLFDLYELSVYTYNPDTQQFEIS